MGLMDATEYDPRPAQRRKMLIISALVIAVLALLLWFRFRYWPEKHAVDRFLSTLESKQYEQAYALYTSDSGWEQHEGRHKDYTFGQFRLDWGPSGDYGAISRHHVECAVEPPKKDYSSSSGVIVVVTINGTQEPRSLWVEKKSRTIGFSPLTCDKDCEHCLY